MSDNLWELVSHMSDKVWATLAETDQARLKKQAQNYILVENESREILLWGMRQLWMKCTKLAPPTISDNGDFID